MHRFRVRFAAVASLVTLALTYGACSGSDHPPVYEVEAGTGGKKTGGTGGTGGSAAATSGGSAGQDASVGGAGAGGSAGQDAGPPANCGTTLTCRGHSTCIPGPPPSCQCDTGYITDPSDATNCIVDESCINIHPLEDHCRQVFLGAHAVAVFFAVDYCAGTAVLPDKLLELAGAKGAGGAAGAGGGSGAGGSGPSIADAFKIREGATDISPTESWRGIYARGVESYLTVAIDISNSLSGDDAGRARLADLSDDLQTLLVPHLAQPNEPAVGISVVVFGANVVELVPFTTDASVVNAGLARLKTDLATLTTKADASSTALYNATYTAIDATQRIRQLRAGVSEDGVLTTGTVVVITDGRNTNNETLDINRVTNTPINVISVTLTSAEADPQLGAALGQPGSFLAPERSDWQNAFTEIATRIDQYPDRAYLLAYCSPATSGTPTVTVDLKQLPAHQTAGCAFDTRLFEKTNPPTCDATFFEKACDTSSCGGFLACGACSSSQCCHGGACDDPAPATTACRSQNELCLPSSPTQYCSANTCVTPPTLGQSCTSLCEAGASYCSAQSCIATHDAGVACASAAECTSQNCISLNPGLEPQYCQEREAHVFENCGGTGYSAVCEPGSSCSNNKCRARAVTGGYCSVDGDCASGICNVAAHVCTADSTCHWNWASKMGGL